MAHQVTIIRFADYDLVNHADDGSMNQVRTGLKYAVEGTSYHYPDTDDIELTLIGYAEEEEQSAREYIVRLMEDRRILREKFNLLNY